MTVEKTVLDLWVCLKCITATEVWQGDNEIVCWKCYKPMVHRRVLVLDDAAVEDAARVLYDRFGDEVGSLGWAFEKDSLLDEWREDARAVLGMEESDD